MHEKATAITPRMYYTLYTPNTRGNERKIGLFFVCVFSLSKSRHVRSSNTYPYNIASPYARNQLVSHQPTTIVRRIVMRNKVSPFLKSLTCEGGGEKYTYNVRIEYIFENFWLVDGV